MDGKRKRQREKEDRSPEAKKIKIVLPEEDVQRLAEQLAANASKTGNMIRRSLEFKKTPKLLTTCTQCYQFSHDIPGETSAFGFEHMCDGTTKHFDMLQKAMEILQSLPTKKAEGVKDTEEEADETKEGEKTEAEGVKHSEEADETKEGEKTEAEGVKYSEEADETKEGEKTEAEGDEEKEKAEETEAKETESTSN